MLAEASGAPIPVPARVTRFHRIARQFRERPALHEVSQKQLPRASRIVHSLAVEAERRGHTVQCADPGPDDRRASHRRTPHEGQLIVTIAGRACRVRLWEKGVTSRAAYEQQVREWEHARRDLCSGWEHVQRPTPFDADASGELNASVPRMSERQSSWGDRKTVRLEERLPRLLREIELQAAEAAERERQRRRAEAEHRTQWKAAMATARRLFLDDYRLQVLDKRIRAWQRAEEIRVYCAAVEERFAGPELQANQAAREWLRLARAQAERLQQLPEMPPDPDVEPEDLKPYLGRWSPYGPA